MATGRCVLNVPDSVYEAQLDALQAAVLVVEISTGDGERILVDALPPETETSADRRKSMKEANARMSRGATKSAPSRSREPRPPPRPPPPEPEPSKPDASSSPPKPPLELIRQGEVIQRLLQARTEERTQDTVKREEQAVTFVQAQWRGKRVRKRRDHGPQFGMQADNIGAIRIQKQLAKQRARDSDDDDSSDDAEEFSWKEGQVNFAKHQAKAKPGSNLLQKDSSVFGDLAARKQAFLRDDPAKAQQPPPKSTVRFGK